MFSLAALLLLSPPLICKGSCSTCKKYTECSNQYKKMHETKNEIVPKTAESSLEFSSNIL